MKSFTLVLNSKELQLIKKSLDNQAVVINNNHIKPNINIDEAINQLYNIESIKKKIELSKKQSH